MFFISFKALIILQFFVHLYDDFYLEIIDSHNPDELNFYIFENPEVLLNIVLKTSDGTLIRFIE